MGFDEAFSLLTGNASFPWQTALYAEFVAGRFPRCCDLPTGLGKTSVISIWLLALAHRADTRNLADFPRRLVYVVNRRTVVDQATREAERIREALVTKPELRTVADALSKLAARPTEQPLAISTLRGQFADNAEWRNDPARPALVVGTVDMIGSRLLFAGYGCGYKTRPLHAGVLGQDSLLVHDEAHLEPAFQDLLTAVEREQERCGDLRRMRVMALTATSREIEPPFTLTDNEDSNEEVRRRLDARKGVGFFQVEDEKSLPKAITDRSLLHKDSGQAILVFLRRVEHVQVVVTELRKAGHNVQQLTGTLRGFERDRLAAEDPVFARFLPRPAVSGTAGTVYLVCTSAGEVGVDISADHMVCDLTPFDSMAQRLGRVNRFGRGDALVDVVHVSPAPAGEGDAEEQPPGREESPLELACLRTVALLKKLPARPDSRHDASPRALAQLDQGDRLAAFTPPPSILASTDILFDTWSHTTVRQRLPGRPPVAEWLHGIAEWEPPQTHVAWRQEVSLISGELLAVYRPADLLEDYPLKPHELLRDRTDRVFAEISTLAARSPELSVWVVAADGLVNPSTLAEVAGDGKEALAYSTVLLPPEAGGLHSGLLDGSALFDPEVPYDVADLMNDPDVGQIRCRIWGQEPPSGLRLVRTIELGWLDEDEATEEDTGPHAQSWRWYVRPPFSDDEGSSTASPPQRLEDHLESAAEFARALAIRLNLPRELAVAVESAARWHDLGKRRAVWQRSICNTGYPGIVLAKSGGAMQTRELNNYRHELGSVIDVLTTAEFAALAPQTRDLVLHLIAAHHGRARPLFPDDEVFDLERTAEVARSIGEETPRRFDRLQRRFGRWGLAYLESLVRVADLLASQRMTSAPAATNGESGR
jgi:CRISPR-associated endonuclease/helicase Cas3